MTCEAAKHKKRQHWYYQSFGECPCCGANTGTYRERRYGMKPKDHRKRYEFRTEGCAGGAGCWSLV